jgi:hypothetical protein
MSFERWNMGDGVLGAGHNKATAVLQALGLALAQRKANPSPLPPQPNMPYRFHRTGVHDMLQVLVASNTFAVCRTLRDFRLHVETETPHEVSGVHSMPQQIGWCTLHEERTGAERPEGATHDMTVVRVFDAVVTHPYADELQALLRATGYDPSVPISNQL